MFPRRRTSPVWEGLFARSVVGRDRRRSPLANVADRPKATSTTLPIHTQISAESPPPVDANREGYREDGKVKTRTLANLSHWPLAKIERLRRVLRDEAVSSPEQGLTMLRSLPHGHVAAVLGTARKIGLDRLLAVKRAPPRMVELVLAMIVARVIDPASKLATARQACSASTRRARCFTNSATRCMRCCPTSPIR